MKNNIAELNNSITRREQEKAAIQSQIDNLRNLCDTEKQAKQDALTANDNAAYLAAHRRIQDYENQIQGLQELIADKEKASMKPEIIKALNGEIAEFEENRKKTIKKYLEAKRTLAEVFANACHAEDEIRQLRLYYMQMGNISEYSGEVKAVTSMEPKWAEAIRFLRDDLTAMGYDVGAILTGQKVF